MSDWYILDDQRRPIRATSEEWIEWFRKFDSCVGDERMGDVRISTVFLGIRFSFESNSPPRFWYTTAFDSAGRNFGQEHCGGSWDQAEETHRRMVQRVRKALGIPEPKEVEHED